MEILKNLFHTSLTNYKFVCHVIIISLFLFFLLIEAYPKFILKLKKISKNKK